MPDRLFEFVNPWTTPLALVSAIVAVAWVCRVRGRRLALVAAVAAAGVGLWQAWKAGPPNGLLDLQIYTNSARAWLDGGSIYDYRAPVFNLSATYPPIGPLLFAVFTPFTADGREVVFTALSLAALFGCAWLVAGLARIDESKRLTWAAWAFAASTVTIPVWLTLRQGQINIIIWLLVLVDLDAIRRKARWTGMAMGLATAIKLIPGLFIVWSAATRRWWTTLRAVAALVLATAIGWALAPADSRRYWTDLLWNSDRIGSLQDARNNSFLGILARLLEPGPLRTGLWLLVVVVVLTGALVRSIQASRSGDLLAVAAIVGCSSVVISPISWTHHLGFLLVALAAFVVSARTRWSLVLCAAAWIFLVDPGGHGDSALFSTIRGCLAVLAVFTTPIRRIDPSASDGVDQTETTPRSLETKSALPS